MLLLLLLLMMMMMMLRLLLLLLLQMLTVQAEDVYTPKPELRSHITNPGRLIFNLHTLTDKVLKCPSTEQQPTQCTDPRVLIRLYRRNRLPTDEEPNCDNETLRSVETSLKSENSSWIDFKSAFEGNFSLEGLEVLSPVS